MKPVSRARRWLVIGLVAVLVFTGVGFFAVPPILKAQLEKQLTSRLGRQTTVGKVRFNPYTLALTLENFAIQEQRPEAKPFLAWRRLHVNFDALSSLLEEWVLSEITLEDFETRLAIHADETLNVSDLIAKLSPPAGATPPPSEPGRPIRIRNLRVANARMDFSDASRPQPFTTLVGPVAFAVSEFRTVSERGAPYQFTAVTESGEKFAWSGTLFADPLRSQGEFNVEQISLPKYAPYYADRLQGEVASGTVSLRGRYEIDLGKTTRALKLQQGFVQLRGFALRDRDAEDIAVELPVLDVNDIEADAVKQWLRVNSVAVLGGQARVRREKDGTVNLLALLRPPAAKAPAGATPPAPPALAAAAPAVAATKPPPPDARIGEFVVKDFEVRLDDLAAPRPVQFAIAGLQTSVKAVSLAQGAEMPLQVAFTARTGGTVKLEGIASVTPLAAKLKLDVANFALLPLSPYLEQFLNARITKGTVTTTLAADIAQPEDQPLAATVSGDVQLAQLGLVDSAQNEDLAGFATLSLRGLRASTAPTMAVALDEVALAGSYARVVVDRDRSLNLARIVRTTAPASSAPAPTVAASVPPAEAPQAAPATAAPAASADRPVITIGKIVLSDGEYRFTDRSLEPHVAMAVRQFGGTIAGLASNAPTKADVTLNALVDGVGPVAIRGKLDPLGPVAFVDLTVDCKNVDLTPLSPYSGKYAGYALARGKLLLDVKLRLEGKSIDAKNVLTLNQFTFGNAVESPDATKLPVRLGVALLKDIDGNIVIDVPVHGNTDSPDFHIGRVVLRVIVNLLTKAAVSPFSLLGAAFGGGGEELAFQDFEPGSTALQAAGQAKLETMVKALTNRPGLNLGLEGCYDEAADTYALRRVKLADKVRRSIWEKKRESDPNVAPPEQLAITPEEHAAMIKALYDAQFPPGTEFGAPLPPPPPMPPPPAPPAGFFTRMARALSLQARREARIAEEKNAQLVEAQAKARAAATDTGIPLEQMTERLADAMAVDPNDLRALAQARAQAVRDYFSQTGKIAGERLYLVPGQAASEAEKRGARVFLALQ